MDETTFIYVLIDPRDLTPKIERIRYVGKADHPDIRYREHLGDLKGKSHKSRWIQQLHKLGLKPIMSVIEECPIDIWEEREVFWIQKCKNQGAPLTNGTPGGVGIKRHTPESKAKISKALKGRK